MADRETPEQPCLHSFHPNVQVNADKEMRDKRHAKDTKAHSDNRKHHRVIVSFINGIIWIGIINPSYNGPVMIQQYNDIKAVGFTSESEGQSVAVIPVFDERSGIIPLLLQVFTP